MKDVTSTGVFGCYYVHVTPSFSDDRGQLFRPYEAVDAELTDKLQRLDADYISDLVVRSYRDVFRGMHIQHKSAPQWKYVRALRGAISGAVVDTSKVRHGEIFARVDLSADAPKTGPRREVGLLVPPWCAWGYWSGFETCDVAYRIWGPRVVEAERVIHYQGFGLGWTPPAATMSDRDRNAPPLTEVDTGW